MTPDELTAKREKEKKSLALNYALVVGGLGLLGYSFFFATVSLLVRCVPWHPSHAPPRLPPLQTVALLSTLSLLLGLTPTICFLCLCQPPPPKDGPAASSSAGIPQQPKVASPQPFADLARPFEAETDRFLIGIALHVVVKSILDFHRMMDAWMTIELEDARPGSLPLLQQNSRTSFSTGQEQYSSLAHTLNY